MPQDMLEHPDVLRIQKYGYAKKPVPDCFPKPKAVELFEDLEDDIAWDIDYYETLIEKYKSRNLSTFDAEWALLMLRKRLDVIETMKKSASE